MRLICLDWPLSRMDLAILSGRRPQLRVRNVDAELVKLLTIRAVAVEGTS